MATLEVVLLKMLGLLGERWKTVCGTILAGLALLLMGIDGLGHELGYTWIPVACDVYIDWALRIGAGLAGIGLAHKAIKSES